MQALLRPSFPRGCRLYAASPPALHSTAPSPPSQWLQTAMDLARQENYTEIVRLLEGEDWVM